MTLKELVAKIQDWGEKCPELMDQPAMIDTIEQQNVSDIGVCGAPSHIILLLDSRKG